MANFIPVNDRIMVKRINHPEELKTKSDIWLPATNNGNAAAGLVVAAGPGGLDQRGDFHPQCCKPGDIVMVPGLAGWEPIRINNEPYFVGRARDVLGIYRPEEAMPEIAVPPGVTFPDA